MIQRRRYRRRCRPSCKGGVRSDWCGAISWMPRRFNRSQSLRRSYARSATIRGGFCFGRPGPRRRTATVVSGSSARGLSARLADERGAPRGRPVPSTNTMRFVPFPVRVFADASTPFFAGANVPSRKASLQSNWPHASSSLRKARHSDHHTSCRSHSASRRPQVAPLAYGGGTSRQRAPLRSTHKIPSKPSRSAARGHPPRGGAFPFGNTGAIFAHCASVRRRRMRRSSNRVIHHTIQRGF
ncbi:MAG: hypothetical protein JWM95_5339 [Gemmatimonadetes bacterium]|nr:hypothetical protein [Gemmatimonadota bacterium]